MLLRRSLTAGRFVSTGVKRSKERVLCLSLNAVFSHNESFLDVKSASLYEFDLYRLYNKQASVAWYMKTQKPVRGRVGSEKVPFLGAPCNDTISIILTERQRSHQREREKKSNWKLSSLIDATIKGWPRDGSRERADRKDVKGSAITSIVDRDNTLRNAAYDLVDERRPITADGCRRYLEGVHAIHSCNI